MKIKNKSLLQTPPCLSSSLTPADSSVDLLVALLIDRLTD
jgi:hypothetical protein